MQTLLSLFAIAIVAVASLFGILAGVWGLSRIPGMWRTGVNLEGLSASLQDKLPSSPLPIREEDALYQGGRVVGRVQGVTVDEQARTVHFVRIVGPVDFLNPGPDPIIFRRYRLRYTHIETVTGQSPTPYVYDDVTCVIFGPA